MSPATFDNLLSRVGPSITKQSTRLRKPISAGERLAVALRYLVTGDSMQTISFSFHLGYSTVCDIIGNTCEAIWETLSSEFVPAPKNSDEWRKSVMVLVVFGISHTVGAIDGKHIMIQAPVNAGSQYYNYKGTHSIVLLAVCDYNYCFTLLDIGDYGRMSDGGVLSNSSFGNAMKTNSLALPNAETVPGIKSPIPYFFVGDQVFPLSTNMLRPYPSSYLQLNQRIFNYRLSRTRRVIENAFGILSTKFRVFRRLIIAKPSKVTKVVQAACVLHNYLKITEALLPPSSKYYCPSGYIDQEDRQGNVIPGNWRSEGDNRLQSVTQSAVIDTPLQPSNYVMILHNISILMLVSCLGNKAMLHQHRQITTTFNIIV